ncbi:MAG: hypothetical protein HOW97_08055 [Catenulispora sp.]|nr:hypothetical protein [Catenulispora sp.]
MTDATHLTPATAVLRACASCDVSMLGGVAVGLLESGSGPGHVLYACAGCVKRRNLLPLNEQDDLHGDGRLVYRGQ